MPPESAECDPRIPGPGDETDQLTTFAEVMRTLGDETRLRILRLLRDQTLCVCDLATALGASQPLVSHHLKTLKAAGLVVCRKEGQWVYYEARLDTFRRLGLEGLWSPGRVLAPAAPAGRPA